MTRTVATLCLLARPPEAFRKTDGCHFAFRRSRPSRRFTAGCLAAGLPQLPDLPDCLTRLLPQERAVLRRYRPEDLEYARHLRMLPDQDVQVRCECAHR